jgi:hypothetical protein
MKRLSPVFAVAAIGLLAGRAEATNVLLHLTTSDPNLTTVHGPSRPTSATISRWESRRFRSMYMELQTGPRAG